MSEKYELQEILGEQDVHLPSVDANVTYLDVIQKKKNDIVQSGSYEGMLKEDARELKAIQAPTNNLLPEFGPDGRIILVNREINEVLLSLPPDEVRDVEYSEFPSSVKTLFEKRLQLVVLFWLSAGVMAAIGVAPLSMLWVSLGFTALVGLASWGTYITFKTKDYVIIKGIVANISINNNIAASLLRRPNSKSNYIVTLLTPQKKWISFVYPYSTGKKELKDIKEGSPISVFVRKDVVIKDSKDGPLIPYVLGFEIGEGSQMFREMNEFGEEMTAQDFLIK